MAGKPIDENGVEVDQKDNNSNQPEKDPNTVPQISKEPEPQRDIEDKRPSTANTHEFHWDGNAFDKKAKEIFVGDTITIVNDSGSPIKLNSNNSFSTTTIDTGSISGGSEFMYTFTSTGTWLFNIENSEATLKVLVH